MFCPQCGHKIPDGAAFCGHCGAGIPTAINAPAAANIPAAANPINTAPGKKKGKGKIIALAVAIIAIIAIVVTAGVLFTNNQKAHANHAIGINIVLDGYDGASASRIPVQLSGTDVDGNSVDQLTYLTQNGATFVADQELIPGDYTATFPASPLTGTSFYRPADPVTFTIEPDADETYVINGGRSVTFTSLPLIDVPDADIDAAKAYADQDAKSSSKSASLYSATKEAKEEAEAEAARQAEEAARQAEEAARQDAFDGVLANYASYISDFTSGPYQFAYADIDGDGDDELFLGQSGVVIHGWDYVDGSLLTICQSIVRGSYKITPGYTLFYTGSGGAYTGVYQSCTWTGSDLVTNAKLEWDRASSSSKNFTYTLIDGGGTDTENNVSSSVLQSAQDDFKSNYGDEASLSWTTL